MSDQIYSSAANQADLLEAFEQTIPRLAGLGPNGALVGAVLKQFFDTAHLGATFEELMGSPPGRGRTPFGKRVQLWRRNKLLRALAVTHYGHLTPQQQRAAIADEARAYIASRWPQD